MSNQVTSVAVIGVNDIERMALSIAKSRLFGMKTVEEAAALMLIAQSEGRHPASAAQDYHIIQGRPALKADAMLARFLSAGGKVEWHKYEPTIVDATFSHPQGGSVRFAWTLEDAKRIGLATKDNWRNYPRAMLRARVISEGIRTVFPGVAVGMYTPEEVHDFDAPRTVSASDPPPPAWEPPVPEAPANEAPEVLGALTVEEAGKMLRDHVGPGFRELAQELIARVPKEEVEDFKAIANAVAQANKKRRATERFTAAVDADAESLRNDAEAYRNKQT